MLPVIKVSWALFFGIALIMLGNGLQTSLLGLRASIEGFPTAATGVIMSAFYVGFLAGSYLTPRIVKKVGYIRVFAAWSSMASAAILLHGLFIDPVFWTAMRFVTGFCYAGLYVVAESWLNEKVDNRNRGQLLSVYMVVQYVGLAGGQLLLNLASPAELVLFLLTSVLISLALVPISLTASEGGRTEEQEHLGLPAIFKLAPLGVATCAGAGLGTGALLGMGAVFAEQSGLSVGQISVFMTMMILGAVILQFPIGRISDFRDRRHVIIGVHLVAITATVAAFFAMDLGPMWTLTLIFAVGGTTMPLYALGVAFTNDQLRPAQMVAASSGLVLVFGLGASLGPVGIAAAMAAFGPGAFYLGIIAIHIVLVILTILRRPVMQVREVEQSDTLVFRGGTGSGI